MHSRRPPADDIAARRLALIAAGAGGGRGGPTDEVVADDTVETAGADAPWWADHTRVADRTAGAGVLGDASAVTEPAPLPPPAIPLPGRHAARRRTSWGVVAAVRDRVPPLAPVHVAVIALVVAAGLAVTTWWVVRDDPGAPVAPVAAEAVEPLVPAASPASSAGTTPTGDGGQVTVDVAGKVRRPGIVVLDAGSRVTDAVEAAGGARPGVDLTSINLARLLVDGEQIVVGARGAPGGAAGGVGGGVPGAASSGSGPGAAPVNLNLATQAELEALPDVGPVTAQAIIAWREERGGFTSVDELLEVDGIGEKTLAKLAPHVTV